MESDAPRHHESSTSLAPVRAEEKTNTTDDPEDPKTSRSFTSNGISTHELK
jgi:hypothetical protein